MASNTSSTQSPFKMKKKHGSVVLNFTETAIDDFGVYARAYHKAGRALADRLDASNGYTDVDACPMVFLYRHSFELFLKAMVIAGNEYFKTTQQDTISIESMLKGKQAHHLSYFVAPLKKIFKAIGWSWDTGLEDALKALESVDPFSYSFRYPVKTDASDALPDDFHFNALTFCDSLDQILHQLDGGIAGNRHCCEITIEIAYHHENFGA